MWSRGQVKNLSKEVIESGLVDNAKPIYFHPVLLHFSGSAKFIPDQDGDAYLTLTILNNSSEELTKTEFLNFIDSLENLTFAYITGVSCKLKTTNGFIYEGIIEWYKTNGEWHIITYDSVGNNYASATAGGKITWSNLDVIRDGVNKIN